MEGEFAMSSLRTDKPGEAISWQQLLARAKSPDEIVTAARNFIAKFDHQTLARLPGKCQPPKFMDGNDVAEYAYELVSHHCADDDAELIAVVNDLAAFFSQAATRLSQLATVGRGSQRLFG